MILNSNFFFNIQSNSAYPTAPFHPTKNYPEHQGIFKSLDPSNLIYEMVRELFVNAGYDEINKNTINWNPFRGLIKNNDRIVIKPNLVTQEKNEQVGTYCITTHASIVRPIIDYLYLLKITDQLDFKILLADVPLQSAEFDLIIRQNGLEDLISYYKNNFPINLELIDLRQEIAIISESGFIQERIKVNNDPLGYTNVHLSNSFLDEIIQYHKKFSVGSYSNKETAEKHAIKGNHFYQIPNSIINSDLFINIPKIKTHQKSGITIALKNLIGINGDKSWIPHYRRGSPKFMGDEFSDNKYIIKYLNRIVRRSLEERSELIWKIAKFINKKIIKRIFFNNNGNDNISSMKESKYIMSGAWYGNDTLWRPILDLNYLLMYINKNGKMTNQIQRKYICISDGITAAEGNGPISPIPKKLGLITLSENPVIHDVCCAKIMGFEWQKIPQLKNSVKLKEHFHFDGNTDNIFIKGASGNSEFKKYTYENLPKEKFIAPPGWINYL